MFKVLTKLCLNNQIAYIKLDNNGRNFTSKVNNDNNNIPDCKIIILVNKYTMSAAEIFTIALKENLSARVIGNTTFGKNLILTCYNIDAKHSVMIPKYMFLSPNGHNIRNKGIEPDIQCDDSKLDGLISAGNYMSIIQKIT